MPPPISLELYFYFAFCCDSFELLDKVDCSIFDDLHLFIDEVLFVEIKCVSDFDALHLNERITVRVH